MKEEKVDLRIVKTKKNLYESLLLLMEEKEFENIKVSDICDKAFINRSTFYAHFEDKYMLLDSLIKDLKRNLKEELDKNNSISNTKEYYMQLIKLLLDHVEEKKSIYQSIMIHNRSSIAMDMIYDTLNEDVTKHLEEQNSYPEIPLSFVSKFYLGAIFNVGMEWIKNDALYTREEILEYLSLLIPENPFSS